MPPSKKIIVVLSQDQYIIVEMSNFNTKTLCILTIDFSLKMLYNQYRN